MGTSEWITILVSAVFVFSFLSFLLGMSAVERSHRKSDEREKAYKDERRIQNLEYEVAQLKEETK